MSTILSLAPQNVWKHFYSLTQVPRPSGYLKKVQEFLLNFGKSVVEGLTTQVLMVNPDDDDNPILTLTAPAREHAALIIANMNRKMGTTEWKVGEVVVSEYIDIEYTGKYASDALSELSSAAGKLPICQFVNSGSTWLRYLCNGGKDSLKLPYLHEMDMGPGS